MTMFTNRRPTNRPALPTPAEIENPPDPKLTEWWYEVKKFWMQQNILQQETGLQLGVQIRDEITARVDADGILATEIASLVVSIGTKSKISVQGSAPSGPAVNDLWLDTSDNNKYKFWDGAAWQYKQDLVLAAAVSTEASVRAGADGFLSGKYTLTVAAGNVVTGMNITSSTGTGTDISDVTFVTTNFKIYNSVTGVSPFSISGTTIQLVGAVQVLGSITLGQVTGTGALAAQSTADWQTQVTGTGKPSDNADVTLTAINGELSLSGGGLVFSSGSPKLRAGQTAYDTGTGFWLGVDGGTPKLSIGNSGGDKMLWTGSALSITGAITATSGTIGGFAIGSTALIAGTGPNYFEIRTTSGSPGIYFGDSSTGVFGVLSKNGAFFGDGITGDKAYIGEDADTPDFSAGIMQLWDSGTLKIELKATNGSGTFAGDLNLSNAGVSEINFGSDNHIYELNGITLKGGGIWPVRLDSAGLYLNGNAEPGTSFAAARIYWSSSIYFYESGGLIYINDGNGDRPIT